MTAQLKSAYQDQTLILTLSDPAMRNALGPAMYAAGTEALLAAESNPDIRSVDEAEKLVVDEVEGGRVAGLGVEPELEFERIRLASEALQVVAPQARFISAGMSEDFEVAIANGATHVRIGTAITGKRQY